LTQNSPVSISIKDIKTAVTQLKLDKDAFVDWIDSNTQAKPGNFVIIKKINQSVERVDDEMRMHDLEAGPNRCAVVASK